MASHEGVEPMARKPRLLVTRRLPEAVEARAARNFYAELNPADRAYDRSGLIAAAGRCDALLVCHTDALSANVIERLPDSVRALATFSVGYEHIDVAAAQRRGIIVTNTPDVVTTSTAEITLLLLLGAARRASEGERTIRVDGWQGWTPTQLLGTQLSGKRLGIIGMGRIGQAVAQRARGFDMRILYHNRRPLSPEQEHGAIYYQHLDRMLQACDFLSLHCPLTDDTHHLLNASRLKHLPPEAIVVNAARGGLIDDEALIAALQSGRLAAAGLDVYNHEPHLHPSYQTLPNTLLLPHLGTATHEARISMGFRALDNLEAVFAGREPLDRIV